jgi:hypothetical protein
VVAKANLLVKAFDENKFANGKSSKILPAIRRFHRSSSNWSGVD